jgi:hypothetical protein
LPRSLHPDDAACLAIEYAAETRNLVQAEFFAAGRRYRQALIIAQSHKLQMLEARKKYEQAFDDVAWLDNVVITGRANEPKRLSSHAAWFLADGTIDPEFDAPSATAYQRHRVVRFTRAQDLCK